MSLSPVYGSRALPPMNYVPPYNSQQFFQKIVGLTSLLQTVTGRPKVLLRCGWRAMEIGDERLQLVLQMVL